MSDRFPPISKELLKALEEEFPDKGPTMGFDADRERERAGVLYVVRFLRDTYEEQQEE